METEIASNLKWLINWKKRWTWIQGYVVKHKFCFFFLLKIYIFLCFFDSMTWTCRGCFEFSNRFDGVNSNLGHSTQRRHNLWIIYDQLFIITYFLYSAQKNCAHFKIHYSIHSDCNQRLFIFIHIYVSQCVLFFPAIFLLPPLSGSSINFHKSANALVAGLSSISDCHDIFYSFRVRCMNTAWCIWIVEPENSVALLNWMYFCLCQKCNCINRERKLAILLF